jgi:hypothetical protein
MDMLGFRKRKKKKVGEYNTRNFIIYTFYQLLLGKQIKKTGIG